MEMNIETVNFYFSHIHRAINKSGLLYCVNRYIKKTSGDTIKFKKFPFDEKWSFEISRKSFSQPLIHEALLRRTNFKNYKTKRNYPIKGLDFKNHKRGPSIRIIFNK